MRIFPFLTLLALLATAGCGGESVRVNPQGFVIGGSGQVGAQAPHSDAQMLTKALTLVRFPTHQQCGESGCQFSVDVPRGFGNPGSQVTYALVPTGQACGSKPCLALQVVDSTATPAVADAMTGIVGNIVTGSLGGYFVGQGIRNAHPAQMNQTASGGSGTASISSTTHVSSGSCGGGGCY